MTPDQEAYRAAWIAARIAGADLWQAFQAGRSAYQHKKD
jgi:hypothetical protein